jgi:hypothetical protein
MTSDIPDTYVDYLTSRCEAGLPSKGGKLNERHLPEAERRGIHPRAGTEQYRQRATATTDRLPVFIAPNNQPLRIETRQKPKPHPLRGRGLLLLVIPLALSMASGLAFLADLYATAALCLLLSAISSCNWYRGTR